MSMVHSKVVGAKFAITLVNTKVNCNIASIYGNGATKSCQLQNINTKVVKVNCD